MQTYSRIFCILLITALCSCGGGGGGSEFKGAAVARVETKPAYIDTGDRTKVTAEISEVNENGVQLKFRFPIGLVYVVDSSYLIVDGEEIDIGPLFNVSDGTYNYLVFFLSQSDFDDDFEGKITFLLEGAAAVDDGDVEVDPDVDDPNIPDTSEFSASSPEFSAEDAAYINVDDA